MSKQAANNFETFRLWHVRIPARQPVGFGGWSGSVISAVRGRGRQATRAINVALPVTLVAGGIIGAIFFGAQTLTPRQLAPPITYTAAAAPRTADQTYMSASRPTHISIPSVGIDADTVPVGLDSNGSIQLPSVLEWLTGWYDKSPTPGEKGPAIIVGHLDSYKGVSVFWRLRDVKAGDTILINRQDGSVAKFRADSLKQFDRAKFPTGEVYGNIGYAGLRLITCGGAFDASSGDYTQNTVVYASLIQ